MRDVFDRLVARATQRAPVLVVRRPSRFEPSPTGSWAAPRDLGLDVDSVVEPEPAPARTDNSSDIGGIRGVGGIGDSRFAATDPAPRRRSRGVPAEPAEPSRHGTAAGVRAGHDAPPSPASATPEPSPSTLPAPSPSTSPTPSTSPSTSPAPSSSTTSARDRGVDLDPLPDEWPSTSMAPVAGGAKPPLTASMRRPQPAPPMTIHRTGERGPSTPRPAPSAARAAKTSPQPESLPPNEARAPAPGPRTMDPVTLLTNHLGPALVEAGALTEAEVARLVAVPPGTRDQPRRDGRTPVAIEPVEVPAATEVHLHIDRLEVRRPPAPQPSASRAVQAPAGSRPVDHTAYLDRQRRR